MASLHSCKRARVLGGATATAGTVIQLGADVMRDDYEAFKQRLLIEGATFLIPGAAGKLMENSGLDDFTTKLINSRIEGYSTLVGESVESMTIEECDGN